ncbi:MAG: hypothetical protein ACRDKW_09550 [Actinomycetota bacterium]
MTRVRAVRIDEVLGRWRVGRKVGRTIYVQLGPEASDDDPLIGVMDTRALAVAAVQGHNRLMDASASSSLPASPI